jgi:maltooligosyltrehalose synthase
MVRPDDGAVDHLDGLADPFGIVDRLQQEIPDARQPPPTELPIDRRPLAEEIMPIPRRL